MNNIFIKNLAALKKRNPKLAQKLESYIPTELPKIVQENGAYNLLYKERYLHNQENPLAEAREIFSMAKNTPVSIHFIYGLGLGYLFQIASSNSTGNVILYEPDLNVLWFSFTLVDFSFDIAKPNVHITSDYDAATEIIYQKSGTKNTPELLSLPSKRELHPEEFKELVESLQNIVGTFYLNLKFTKEKLYHSLKFLLQNIPNLKQEIPLLYYKDSLKDKTAVIVSAGPSLDKNIGALIKNRYKYVLFAVGTAVKTLYKHGIKPDFICIIETYDSSRQLEGLDLSNVNLITEPYSHPRLRHFNFKKIFSHIGANMPVNHFWAEVCDESISEYWSRGTVSYTAINSARLLGCSKIVLVGQDLAYTSGQCYSKDSVYKDLVCEYNKEKEKWEIVAKNFQEFAYALSPDDNQRNQEITAKKRLENLNNSLYYVKGINGDMIPTESVYAAFIKPLSDYTKLFDGPRYINTSLAGAQIDGYENLSLEKALADSTTVGKFELNEGVEFNEKDFELNLRKKINELNQIVPYIEQGQNVLRSLKNDLERYKTVNTDILKALKKASMNYIVLTSECTKKSLLFDFITITSKIDLDYEMKMTTEFTYDRIRSLVEKLAIFYDTATVGIKEVEGLINESFDTESEESISND